MFSDTPLIKFLSIVLLSFISAILLKKIKAIGTAVKI